MARVHGNFEDLAVRLIAKNGRPVSIRRDTGTVDADVAKPWLGKTAVIQDTATIAVFLDNANKDFLLMIPGAPDQRTLIEAEDYFNVFIAAKGLNLSIQVSDTLVDGSTVWEIKQVRVVQPGPTPVMWMLKVSN